MTAIHALHGIVDVELRCTCGDTERVDVRCERGGSDVDEVEDLALLEAGWSEQGFCPVCDREQAQADAADRAMREAKERF